MPKISIVVPVYKVESYLNRCVDSILNQTFTDFECILVDDGSPDKCPQICDEYAKKDSRIRVIHKTNGGLSDARNAGIEIAQSDYLSFVDSDDWIHPQMLEILYGVIKNSDAGFVSCGMHKAFNHSADFDCFDVKLAVDTAEIYSSDLVLCNFLKEFFWKIKPYACGKLYNKKCFDNVKYNTSMKLYEDEYIYPNIVDAAGTIGLINEKLYYYFQSENSLMRNKLDKKFFLTLKSLQHLSDFMREKKIYDEMYLFENRWMLGYMDLYYRIKDENPALMGQFKEYKSLFRKKWVQLFFNPCLTKTYKLLLCVFTLSPRMAKSIYKYLTS